MNREHFTKGKDLEIMFSWAVLNYCSSIHLE